MVAIKKSTIVLLALLAIFFFRGLYLNSYHSLTSDEPVIYTGLALWKTGNFEHSPTHPPAMKLLTAIFTLPLHPNIVIPEGFPNIDEFLYGRQLIFQFNQQIFQKMIDWGRFPALLLGLLAAVYVYKWASEITNKKSALLAVTLYIFFPSIVALSAVADNDIMITAFFLMTAYYFKHYISGNSTKDAVLTGVCLGVTLLSKHTGILVIPIMLFASLIILFTSHKLPMLKFIPSNNQNFKRSILAIIAFFVFIGIISAAVVNAGYFFQGTFTPLGEYKFEQNFFPIFNSPALSWIPVPLPYWYLKGLETNQIFSVNAHYFHGNWVTTEDWYFFIFSFLVKTPIPLLIMLLIALVFYKKLSVNKRIDMILILLTVVGITLFFSLKQYKLGIRHLLPIYPFMFILVAMLWHHVSEVNMVRLKKFLMLMFAWYLISTTIVHPYYLSYMNGFVGGSENGYKWFLDSNVDWGQDLNAVKSWMDKSGYNEIGLSYYGSDVPQIRGIKSHMIPCEKTTGLHVLSINNLYGNIFTGQPKNCYEWLRNIQPTDRIGYSMLVYNIPQ